MRRYRVPDLGGAEAVGNRVIPLSIILVHVHVRVTSAYQSNQATFEGVLFVNAVDIISVSLPYHCPCTFLLVVYVMDARVSMCIAISDVLLPYR